MSSQVSAIVSGVKKWIALPLSPSLGGTGQSAYTNGQINIGNAAGGLTKSTISIVAHQTTISNGDGAITIGTVQNIDVTSSPTFSSLILTDGLTVGAASSQVILREGIGSGGVIILDGATNGGDGIWVTRASTAENGAHFHFFTNNVLMWEVGLHQGSDNYQWYNDAASAFCLLLNSTTNNVEITNNVLIGTSTTPTGAVSSIVLSGSTLGSAGSSFVSIGSVSVGATSRFGVQAAAGNVISLGNNRLDFAASTGYLSIAGTDIGTWSANGLQVPRLGIGQAPDAAIPLMINAASSNTRSFLTLTDGTVRMDYFIGTAGNVQIGTSTNHPFIFYANNLTVFQSYGTRDTAFLGNVMLNASGADTIPTGATHNFIYGNGTTTPVLGPATADMVSTAGVDRVNTRHAAAGNRMFANQSERGSPIYIGDDAIDFAATTALITVNATDILTMTSTSLTLADAVNVAVNATTGTKIGTAITQKLGFYNATPIAQRAGAAQVAIATTASTQTTPFGYTTQAQADAIVTLANELRAWAVAQGFIKGAA